MIRWAALAVTAAAVLAACGGATDPQSPITIPSATAAPTPPADPVDVDIPEIAVHSTLQPVGLTADGSLETPDLHHVDITGYYHQGANGVLPGAVGPAILVGHRDGYGKKGSFWRLGELTNGETVFVDLADKTRLTFTVYEVLHVNKGAFPTSTVYRDTTDSEVRLVTCSGPFLNSKIGYADNTIVFARETNKTTILN